MADAVGIGSAVAVGAALVIRWAMIAGRRNRLRGHPSVVGRAEDADAEARRAERMIARRGRRAARTARRTPPSPTPQGAPVAQPPPYPGIGGRALGRAGAMMATEATPTPVDEVTFAQLVERARWLVVDRQDASPNMVRAELGIDYEITARVLDELELRGVVGSSPLGLMPRQVLVPRGQ